MLPLVFLLDVDNTLLDNDRLKAHLARRIRDIVGARRSDRFWEIYEEVRHEQDYVDFPATLDRFQAEHPDAPNQQLRDLVTSLPFASYLYPGALEAIRHLKSIGSPVILSDGDPAFQVMKIERSGLAAAVDGRVVITIHKETELSKVFEGYHAEHYVLIDDKPDVLSRVEGRFPDLFTTVFICQGKYAHRGPGERPPDLVLTRIGDLVHVRRSEFLRLTKGSETPPPEA